MTRNISVYILILALFSGLGLSMTRGADMLVSPDEVKYRTTGTSDFISVPGFDIIGVPGTPMLPVRTVFIPIPDSYHLERVNVGALSWRSCPRKTHVSPIQAPCILGDAPAERTRESGEIYRSAEPFPEAPWVFQGVRQIFQKEYAVFLYYPVRWHPLTGSVEVLADFDMQWTLISRKNGCATRKTVVPSTFLTPEEIIEHRTSAAICEKSPDDPEYIIVTSEALRPAFEPLVSWKTQKGVKTWMQTVEEIQDRYPGRDAAEKVRNFIIDCYHKWNIRYVLLGGDTNQVPDRITWAMDCEAGYYPHENEIRADLYFADLDGSWDANGDDTFGEVEDDVDLVPEVFIGRAPAENIEEAEAIVAKWLRYEQNPVVEHLYHALFAAEILWQNPYTDSSVYKDMMDSESFPPRYDPIQKLYESWGNESKATVIEAMNTGPHFINHAGHAFNNVLGVGTNYMNREDVNALENAESQFIMYSIGCWAASFDYNNIGETFLTNPHGGAVAFIGNNRYGWASPGNPGWGYSDQIDRRFFHTMFSGHCRTIGEVLAATKLFYVPYSNEENVWRWHQYQLNLLGDPEMPLWLSIPRMMSVDCPHVITPDMTKFPVSLSGVNGEPISGAVVCISAQGRILDLATTDDTGVTMLDFHLEKLQEVTLTATHPDCIPFTQEIHISETGAFADITGVRIFDGNSHESIGNGDGFIEPGEVIAFEFPVKNFGQKMIRKAQVRMESDSELLEFITAFSTYYDIPPGAENEPDVPIVFRVSHKADVNKAIPARLAISYETPEGGDFRIISFPVEVSGPDISCEGYIVYDVAPDGDEDAVAEPGEEFFLNIVLANSGKGWGYAPAVRIASSSPFVAIDEDFSVYPDISPGASAAAVHPFAAAISDSLPNGEFPVLDVAISLEGFPTVIHRELTLVAGRTGFSDDFESGLGRWRHGGAEDCWHISDYRYDSCCHALYFGNEASHEYPNQADAWVEVSPLFLAPDSVLTFDKWFHFPTYGADGLFVEVFDGDTWNIVQYIGGGGALGLLDLHGEWNPVTVQLPSFDNPVKLRFRFSSNDSDVAEGIYVDDVVVTGYTGDPWGSEPELLVGNLTGRVSLERPGVSPPDASYVVNLEIACMHGSHEIASCRTQTDVYGCFSVPVTAGRYCLVIKGDHALSVRMENVFISPDANDTYYTFPELPEGDADGDNAVTSLDFFILGLTYNLSQGDPDFDARADFNQDGAVDSRDFFLLRLHYNQNGESCE